VSTAVDLFYGLVLEDDRRMGEAATDVQRVDAEAVLDERSETPLHWLSRSRGYSKTCDLGGIAISILLAQAPPRARCYGLAADQAQGVLLLDAIAGFVARTPELQGALTIGEFKVSAPRSGATLQVLPADSSTIWGLRPYFAVIDELCQWHATQRTQRVFEGLTTGLAKVADSRLAVLTTSGDPAHWSRGVLDAALADPLWRVSETYGPPPWMDAARLAGERRRLPESSYRRLFLNEWAASEDRLADEDDLAACVVLDGPLDPRPGVRYVVGLDVGVKHDRTAAVVAHAERLPGSERPRVVVDRLQVWTPSKLRPVRLGDVEAWLVEAARRYGARVRLDPWQALDLAQRLKSVGIPVEEFTFSSGSVGRLATTLLTLVRERALALPDDVGLLDELRNLRLRETSPGVYRLDHDRNRHDDRAVAVALAATYLVERGHAGPGRTLSPFARSRPRASTPIGGRSAARTASPFARVDAWGFSAKEREAQDRAKEEAA
jgi:phage terminase large subunit-like protein